MREKREAQKHIAALKIKYGGEIPSTPSYLTDFLGEKPIVAKPRFSKELQKI